MQDKEEIVYSVDDEIYLHLKEAKNEIGIEYKVYGIKDGILRKSGLVTYKAMMGYSIESALRCARDEVIKEICFNGDYIAEVSLCTLDDLKDAKRGYRRAHRNDPKAYSIRFVTSDYEHLFRIPNGSVVEIRFTDRSFFEKCEYKDEYHTKVGDTVFHISEFAKKLEREGGTVRPEPEIFEEQAAWKLEQAGFLLLQRVDCGFDYTFYNTQFELIDGGQIDDSTLTMNEAREMILESIGIADHSRVRVPYDEVIEWAENRG